MSDYWEIRIIKEYEVVGYLARYIYPRREYWDHRANVVKLLQGIGCDLHATHVMYKSVSTPVAETNAIIGGIPCYRMVKNGNEIALELITFL
jgi:hypothetical protein